MKFIETRLPGVIIVDPTVHGDSRGFLLETFHAEHYREGGIAGPFVQDNHSRSRRNTLRGLHAQSPHAQGKLVRCIEGEIYDVAVDARKGSPTYASYVGTTLSAENFRQLYIPPHFVHGFCVLSEVAQVEYKCTEFYHPEAEFSVAWNDPEIGIPWPTSEPLLSDKDRNAPLLRNIQDRLANYQG